MDWLLLAIGCLAFAALVCLVVGPKAPPAQDWPPCPPTPFEPCTDPTWRDVRWSTDAPAATGDQTVKLP